MEPNPYQPPNSIVEPEPQEISPLACPECGRPMEPGYVTVGARLYWRKWHDRSWLVSSAEGIPSTHPAFVGTNKLSGFRCALCELIIFRYGMHKGQHAPRDR